MAETEEIAEMVIDTEIGNFYKIKNPDLKGQDFFYP